MLFFRSGESLNEWLTSKGVARGAVFTVPQLWRLSLRWYHERMSPDFRGRTGEDVIDIFEAEGLTSEFWQPAG
jgi:hypothetical protein